MAIKKANPSWIDVKAKLADFDRPRVRGDCLALANRWAACLSLHTCTALDGALAPYHWDTALRLLDAILNDQPWAPTELGQCLDVIAQAMPGLRHYYRYQKLVEYSRRRGS